MNDIGQAFAAGLKILIALTLIIGAVSGFILTMLAKWMGWL